IERAHLASCLGEVTDAGGTLCRDLLAAVVVVDVVAALKAGRPGELGLLDDVIERHALVANQVAGKDARPMEPPFVATEDQMRIRNAADAGRRRAVTVVGGDRKRLRRDQAAEATLGGE